MLNGVTMETQKTEKKKGNKYGQIIVIVGILLFYALSVVASRSIIVSIASMS